MINTKQYCKLNNEYSMSTILDVYNSFIYKYVTALTEYLPILDGW